MGQHALIQSLDQDQLKDNIPDFSIGDTLRVSLKIVEGEKERTQVFQGTVIARKGRGIAETFSLHRVSYGEGMERVFNLHSPRIISIQVVKKGDVRRAKLYYLRGATGKQAKVQEKIGVKNRMNNSGSQSAQSESANDYDNDKNDFAESELSEPIENSTK